MLSLRIKRVKHPSFARRLRRIDASVVYSSLGVNNPYKERINTLLLTAQIRMRENGFSLDNFDQKKILKAAGFALFIHRNQRRKSGELYFEHPLRVFEILVKEMQVFDWHLLAAAFLHDVVEESKGRVSMDFLERQFGKEVAELVYGMTRLTQISKEESALPKEKRQSLDISRLINHFKGDIRLINLKVADRWDNIETLDSMPLEKWGKKISEALFFYAPLLFLLGQMALSRKLSDVAFKKLCALANKENGLSLARQVLPDLPKNFLGDYDSTYREIKDTAGPFIDELTGYLNNRFENRLQVEVSYITPFGMYLKKTDGTFNPQTDFVRLRLVDAHPIEDREFIRLIQGFLESIIWLKIRREKNFISEPLSNRYRALNLLLEKEGIAIFVEIAGRGMGRVNDFGNLAERNEKGHIQPEYPPLSEYAGLLDFLGDPKNTAVEKMKILRQFSLGEKITMYCINADDGICSLQRDAYILPGMKPSEALILLDPKLLFDLSSIEEQTGRHSQRLNLSQKTGIKQGHRFWHLLVKEGSFDWEIFEQIEHPLARYLLVKHLKGLTASESLRLKEECLCFFLPKLLFGLDEFKQAIGDLSYQNLLNSLFDFDGYGLIVEKIQRSLRGLKLQIIGPPYDLSYDITVGGNQVVAVDKLLDFLRWPPLGDLTAGLIIESTVKEDSQGTLVSVSFRIQNKMGEVLVQAYEEYLNRIGIVKSCLKKGSFLDSKTKV